MLWIGNTTTIATPYRNLKPPGLPASYLNSLGIRPYLTLSGIPPVWMLNENPSPPQHDTCGTKNTRSHLDPQMYGEFAETVVSLAMYARNKAHVDFEYFGPRQ